MSIRRPRYKTGGWQVRVPPYPAQTVPTKEAAKKLELDLLLRKSMGDLYEGAPTTLGAEFDEFIAAQKATKDLSPRTIEFYERCRKFWRPLEERKLSALNRTLLEDMLIRRAVDHPVSANNERSFLLAVLRRAQERGQRIDARCFNLPTVKTRPRRGKALTVEQVWQLASFFPEHVRRLIPLAGFVGQRQHVWFNLTDEMVDLDEARMSLPASLQKNRREHVVYLTPIEVRLLREQMVARAGGTSLLFPRHARWTQEELWRIARKHNVILADVPRARDKLEILRAKGVPLGKDMVWDRAHFHGLVWRDALAAAADANPVFEGFSFHMLRHTAGSLMAAAGMDVAAAAERLGHSDGGALFLRTYRHLYDRERRAAVLRFGETLGEEPEREEQSA